MLSVIIILVIVINSSNNIESNNGSGNNINDKIMNGECYRNKGNKIKKKNEEQK